MADIGAEIAEQKGLSPRPLGLCGDENSQRAAVVAEAITWLKTPFHHWQRVKGAGVDCANFLYAVFRNVGLVPEIEVGDYPSDWYLHRGEERFLGWVLQFGRKIEDPPFQPADVAMYLYGRCFAHAAIIVKWPRIIHAYSPAGMVCWDDALAQSALQKRKREIYRFNGWS